eukprot:806261-Pyramimonas_sp.AAC.1
MVIQSTACQWWNLLAGGSLDPSVIRLVPTPWLHFGSLIDGYLKIPEESAAIQVVVPSSAYYAVVPVEGQPMVLSMCLPGHQYAGILEGNHGCRKLTLPAVRPRVEQLAQDHGGGKHGEEDVYRSRQRRR